MILRSIEFCDGATITTRSLPREEWEGKGLVYPTRYAIDSAPKWLDTRTEHINGHSRKIASLLIIAGHPAVLEQEERSDDGKVTVFVAEELARAYFDRQTASEDWR